MKKTLNEEKERIIKLMEQNLYADDYQAKRDLEQLQRDEIGQEEEDIVRYENEWDDRLSHLKNNETFTKAELQEILEKLYRDVPILGQYRIMHLLQFFGIDENFR